MAQHRVAASALLLALLCASAAQTAFAAGSGLHTASHFRRGLRANLGCFPTCDPPTVGTNAVPAACTPASSYCKVLKREIDGGATGVLGEASVYMLPGSTTKLQVTVKLNSNVQMRDVFVGISDGSQCIAYALYDVPGLALPGTYGLPPSNADVRCFQVTLNLASPLPANTVLKASVHVTAGAAGTCWPYQNTNLCQTTCFRAGTTAGGGSSGTTACPSNTFGCGQGGGLNAICPAACDASSGPVCTPGTTGGGHDPIFYGLNGHRYEVQGVAGRVYSIISERDTQVNAEFIDLRAYRKPGAGDNATYMGAIGIVSFEDKVAVRPGFGNRIEVSVNGVNLDLSDTKASTQVSTRDGTVIKLWSRNRDVPDTVQVSTSKLALTLHAGGHHLNLLLDRMAGGLCDVHGILGQTYGGEEVTGVTRDENTGFKHDGFAIEGTDSDYEVSALFATDSTYNRFGVRPNKRCPQPAQGKSAAAY